MKKTHRRESWVDPRVEVRASPIDRQGTFARDGIRAGELVVVWGGTVVTEADVRAGRVRKGSVAAIEEGCYLAGLPGEAVGPDDFMNHSCDPNMWLADEVTLVAARRDVSAGEELTADYATWEGDQDFVARWACRCGTALCRRRVTGADWRRTDLQERYGAHFSPFIAARMRRERP